MPTPVNSTPFTSGVATTHNITIPAVTSGNDVVVQIIGTQSVTNVTDNGGASPTYTQDFANAIRSGQAHVYRRANVTDGPTQVTITTASNDLVLAVVHEFDTTVTLAESNVGSDSFSASPTASVTTASANQFGMGWGGVGVSRTWTGPGGGWDRLPTQTDPQARTLWHNDDLGTAGSETFNPTIDSATNAQVALVTYEGAGGGGGGFKRSLVGYGGLVGPNGGLIHVG